MYKFQYEFHLTYTQKSVNFLAIYLILVKVVEQVLVDYVIEIFVKMYIIETITWLKLIMTLLRLSGHITAPLKI